MVDFKKIDEVIKDMKMSKLLWLTKNNKFYSLVAEEYMHDKEKYLLYVKESKRKEFMNNYRDVLQMAGSVSDIVVYAKLMHWEHTGEILMLLTDNIDWDVIRESIYYQGHNTESLNVLAHKLNMVWILLSLSLEKKKELLLKKKLIQQQVIFPYLLQFLQISACNLYEV